MAHEIEQIWIDEDPETAAPIPPQRFVGIAPAPASSAIVMDNGTGQDRTDTETVLSESGSGQPEAVDENLDAYAVLFGSDDNDIIHQHASGHALIGGDGDDIIVSTGGNLLVGGAGNDILDATSGDTLRGGPGADIFLLTLGDELITIRDYTPAQGDILVMLNAPADLMREGSSLVSDGKVLVEFASPDMAAAAIGEPVHA